MFGIYSKYNSVKSSNKKEKETQKPIPAGIPVRNNNEQTTRITEILHPQTVQSRPRTEENYVKK